MMDIVDRIYGIKTCLFGSDTGQDMCKFSHVAHGSIKYNHDYATLKIDVNVTNLYTESMKICHNNNIIQAFIKQRAFKLRLSEPDYTLMKF